MNTIHPEHWHIYEPLHPTMTSQVHISHCKGLCPNPRLTLSIKLHAIPHNVGWRRLGQPPSSTVTTLNEQL